ncbi:hypothetical protein B4064_0041 [Caldibacillus thermoamylovorans]|uniref:hypothetical protein n=1 Tax=Caldibacillus thermoamylovorans TaxID=35841 RepID=UPI0005B74946|nr:hypothetical protein [Caldibacillus thermoamylovorans]KIO61328.1 hypothetical protein B4064_0041 [Caldibacillus thermoamylovorans]
MYKNTEYQLTFVDDFFLPIGGKNLVVWINEEYLLLRPKTKNSVRTISLDVETLEF